MLLHHLLWKVSVMTEKLAALLGHNTDTAEVPAPNTGQSEEHHDHGDVCAVDKKIIVDF